MANINLWAAFPAVVVLALYGLGAGLYVRWLRRIDFMGIETARKSGGFALAGDTLMSLLAVVWPISWPVHSMMRLR